MLNYINTMKKIRLRQSEGNGGEDKSVGKVPSGEEASELGSESGESAHEEQMQALRLAVGKRKFSYRFK